MHMMGSVIFDDHDYEPVDMIMINYDIYAAGVRRPAES